MAQPKDLDEFYPGKLFLDALDFPGTQKRDQCQRDPPKKKSCNLAAYHAFFSPMDHCRLSEPEFPADPDSEIPAQNVMKERVDEKCENVSQNGR